MNSFEQVVTFNQQVLGIHQRELGMLPENELKISKKCLDEEAQELVDAHNAGDYIGCVDAAIDSIYFAVGVLYKLGLTPQQMADCFTAVHEANMEKKLGVNAKRASGAADAVKPEGWVPPDIRIANILDEA